MISEHARQELEFLTRAGGGRLTPKAVVEAAADPQSALHRYFDWDDATAAHSHRIETARALIRSVTIVERRGVVRIEAPAYLRDPSAAPGEQGYRQTVELRSEHTQAMEALANDTARLRAMGDRTVAVASALGLEAEAATVTAAIGRLIDAIEMLRDQVRERAA
jgi:hypothetical protein